MAPAIFSSSVISRSEISSFPHEFTKCIGAWLPACVQLLLFGVCSSQAIAAFSSLFQFLHITTSQSSVFIAKRDWTRNFSSCIISYVGSAIGDGWISRAEIKKKCSHQTSSFNDIIHQNKIQFSLH